MGLHSHIAVVGVGSLVVDRSCVDNFRVVQRGAADIPEVGEVHCILAVAVVHIEDAWEVPHNQVAVEDILAVVGRCSFGEAEDPETYTAEAVRTQGMAVVEEGGNTAVDMTW